MKKLLTVLFTAMIAFSLAMPVFAQETTTTTTAKTKKTKMAKTKKTKKEKTTTTTAQ
jgi:hypothetical protein